jgi:Flp pilus assembly protein TadD
MILARHSFLLLLALTLTLAFALMGRPGLALPPDARELNRQGIQLQKEGKLKEAVECYRRAIQLNPTVTGAGYHNNLALALKDLGDLSAAEAEARLALRFRPKRADYHFNLGIILQREKRYTDAETSFRAAVAIDSSDTECHFHLAQVLLAQEALERSEEEIKLALLLKPDNSEYNELLGDVYLQEKKCGDALNQYKQVCESRGFTAATVPGELKAKIDAAKAAASNAINSNR